MQNIPQVQTFISDVLNKYIVSPSVTNVGINGFVFDILTHEEVSLDADITDHYVEDNYAVQDHIAQKPISFTLKGLIGELINEPNVTALTALNDVQSLTSLGGIAPEFASQATQTYVKVATEISNVNSYINQANNLIDIFNDKTLSNTKQKKAFDNFYGLWESRTLCTVETPFGTFQDMAISKFAAIQRDETNIVSDFAVTFKQIRTVSTKKISVPVFSGRTAGAVAEAVEKGQVVGKTEINSILSTAFEAGQVQ